MNSNGFDLADALIKLDEDSLPARPAYEYTTDESRTEWVVDGFIPSGHVTILAGYPGSYKTWLAQYVGVCVASGVECFGRPVSRRAVLYLDRENSVSIIGERLRALGTPDGFFVWGRREEPEPPLITSAEGRERYYLPFIERTDPKPLLIFDTFIRFHGMKENDNSEMQVVTAGFQTLAKAGAAVLILHHAGKTGADGQTKYVRGASEIEGNADLVWGMKKTERGKVSINCVKSRFDNPERYDLKLCISQRDGHSFFIDQANAPF